MNKNNLSYWFPKIKGCGIKTPKTIIITVPVEIQKRFNLDDVSVDTNAIKEWSNKNVIPIMIEPEYFLKNAVFSNKFIFSSCVTCQQTFVSDLIDLNYTALRVSENGTEEIILRELIPYNNKKIPTIYYGLPLRSEFRVFYDFDNRQLLYCVNYWNYNECYNNLYSMSDRIIFKHMRDSLTCDFYAHKKEVEELVCNHMKTVQLVGCWSIDILLDDNNQYWLIDMSLAEQSAYWKPRYEKKEVE